MSEVALKAGTPVHRRALLLVLALILLSTVAAILFVIGPQRKRAAVDTWRGRLSAMADDRQAAIERWIEDAEDNAALVAGTMEVREAVLAGAASDGEKANEPGRGLLDAVLASVASSHHCRSVWVLDGEGRVVATDRGSAPLAPKEADIGRRSAARNQRLLDIINYDGSADIIVAAPVPGGADDSAIGAVVLELDPEGFLFPILRREPTPSRTAETLVIRPEGENLLFLSPLRFRPDRPVTFRLPLATPGLAGRQAVTGPESFGEFVDYRSVPVFAATRRLRNVPWGLVAKVDVGEALSGYRTEVWGIAAIFGLLVVSLSAVGFAFWRRESSVFESSLSESRARYASFLENAADPICFLDPDGTIREVNTRAEEFYGWNREELIGKKVDEILRHPEDSAATAKVPAVLVREGTHLFEAMHVHRHGTRLPVEVSASRVEVDGRPLVMTIARDIRQRQEAEERILQLNRMLKTVLEVSQLIVHEADRDRLFSETCRIVTETGGFVVAGIGLLNDAGRIVPVASSGLPLAEVLASGLPVDDAREGAGPAGIALRERRSVVVHDAAADSWLSPWRQAFHRPAMGSMAACPILVRGEPVAVFAIGAKQPRFFSSEAVTLVEELANDLGHALSILDDRERLRAAEERYRTIFDAAGLGIVQADAEGCFVDVNPAFCRILGRGRADVVGKSWAELTHADDLARNRALFEAMQRGESDRYDLVKHFLRGNGSPVVTNVVVTAVAGAEGARSYIGLVEDVTESRKLEEQLRQVQKMEAVGRLAGGVAHDFNNLLTVITGYSELLGSQFAPKSPEKENLAEIKKAAERAAGLTQQLLAFSRRQVLQSRPVDLHAVVSEMEKMLRRIISEDIDLVTRFAAGPAVVVADRGQLEQVLMNLVVNARDAMPKGGSLTVEVSRFDVRKEHPIATAEEVPPGPWVALTVTDTGHGITPENHEHLFEPFFTTKETGKGTGLGLATVYGIVKQSGGHIWAENAPGGGATFRALFRPSDARPVASLEAVPVRGGPRGNETILLVEDEPAVRAVARTILKACGYALIEAENGAAAVELAARHPGTIHLLLTDVVMPLMGGCEVAERLCRARPGIRVLFSSGYAADAGLAEVMAKQGFAYLSKPFSPSQLAGAVREVLDAP